MLVYIVASLLIPLLVQFLFLVFPISGGAYWILFLATVGSLTYFFPQKKKDFVWQAVLFFASFMVLSFLAGCWIQFYPTGEHVRDYNLISSSIHNPLNPMDPWLSKIPNHYYIFWFKWAASLSYLFNLNTENTYIVSFGMSFSFYITLLFILFSKVFSFPRPKSLVMSLAVATFSNLAGLLFYFRENAHWWGPSRIITGIINEFPVWSFYQADFHPHYATLSLPVLYLILSFLTLKMMGTRYQRLIFLTFLYFFFYRLFMLANPWEVIFLTLAYPGFLLKEIFFPPEQDIILKKESIIFLGIVGGLALCACFLYPPMYAADVKVKMVTSEIGRSAFSELFLHWGGWWSMGLLTIIISFFTKTYKKFDPEVAFFLVLSTLMIILPEIVYVDDSYGPPYERMNFMFKHYMPTWTVTGIAVVMLWGKLLEKKTFWIAVSLFFVLGSLFSLKTLPERYREFSHLQTRLDNADKEMPGIKETIKKFRHFPRGVVLQSSINPYDYTSFIGTLSDKDLYLGWINHLLVLNKDYGLLMERQAELKRLYEEVDCQKKKDIFLKTEAHYLVYSLQEKKDYPQSVSTDFSCFKEIIHEGYNFIYTTN
ncbi:MAG: DUF2298 domain-containing protein [Bacteriovoracaceae bacterium]